MGKRWLNVIPCFQPLRLSNQEVATGLHDRTLVGSSIAICSFCGSDSPLGHDELCIQKLLGSTPPPHHQPNHSPWLAERRKGSCIDRAKNTRGQRRNDIRVRGRCGLHATDCDLKVYCLNDRDARSTLSAKPPSTPVATHVLNRCLSWLDKVSENATKKAPATHSGMSQAVVMSTGG